MDIVIETADRRSFELEIWLFTTVLQIKEMIQKYHGVPVSQQTLSFNGNIMEDRRYVEHYKLFQGSRVLLQLDPAEPRPEMIKHEPAADTRRPPLARSLITVWVPHHVTKFIEFPVDTCSDTVAHLKEAIRDHFHHCTGKRFPASRTMSLFLGGVELKNCYLRLMDCGVTAGSKIEVRPLTFNMWESMTVTVVFPAGKSPTRTVLHVEMNVEDNVSELRKELQMMRASGQFQSPPPMMKGFFFVFKLAVMKEDQTFRRHGVKSGDLIEIFNMTDRS